MPTPNLIHCISIYVCANHHLPAKCMCGPPPDTVYQEVRTTKEWHVPPTTFLHLRTTRLIRCIVLRTTGCELVRTTFWYCVSVGPLIWTSDPSTPLGERCVRFCRFRAIKLEGAGTYLTLGASSTMWGGEVNQVRLSLPRAMRALKLRLWILCTKRNYGTRTVAT